VTTAAADPARRLGGDPRLLGLLVAELEQLRDAPEVERLRRIWEATTLNVLDDGHDERGVPPAWVDLLADLAATGSVDGVVASLRPQGLA
jgi:hypothetical protein